MASSRTSKEIWEYGHEIVKSRSSYIREIAEKFGCRPEYFPTAEQERLYQEALGHVVRVLSTKRRPTMNPDAERGGQVDKRRRTHEHRMVEILNKFRCMERRRLYDPPSNDEIGYYRLIKKYMVSMALFFDSHYRRPSWRDLSGHLLCFSPFKELPYLEEVAEIHSHLSDISHYASGAGGHDLKSLLGMAITDKVQEPEIRRGSEKRNNKFYRHKFNLALMDLHCSHHAKSPPNPDEKKCYERVLNLIAPPQTTPQATCEVNPFLDDGLLDQFEERILDDIRIFNKHFTCIAKDILEKLSFPASWETIVKQCEQKELEDDERESLFFEDLKKDAEDENIINFQRELLDKCEVSNEDLPNYIEDVARSLQLMNYINLSIRALTYLKDIACTFTCTVNSDSEMQRRAESIGWETLHALTLIGHTSRVLLVNKFPQKRKEIMMGNEGGFRRKKRINDQGEEDENGNHEGIFKGGIFMEDERGNNNRNNGEMLQPPRNNNNNDNTYNNYKSNNNYNNNDDDVKMLKEILEEVGEIQDWHSEPLPSEAEMQVIHKICHCLVSSTHFFTCTLAYEQMTHVLHHHPVDADKRAPRRKRKGFVTKFSLGFYYLSLDVVNFIFILRGFMDSLQAKLNRLRINKLNGAALSFDIW